MNKIILVSKKSPQIIKKLKYFIILSVFCLFTFSAQASALLGVPVQRDQKTLKQLGIYFVDDSSTNCDTGVGAISSTLPATVPEPYKSLFTKASATYNINPALLTALFLTENGNTWKPFDGPWGTSSSGAQGPFQFLPGTWDGNKVDGNGDGVMDVNNIYDAAFSAANMEGKGSNVTSPLGDISKPFVKDTLLYMAAAYNWGGGNVESKTTPNSPLSVAPKETQDYVNNVYMLITSGFTKSGKATYGDPVPPSGSLASTSTSTTSASSPTIVVLDPGHAGANTSETDPSAGLETKESGGAAGEMQAMWDTAQIIKAKLEKDGYKVVLTKNSENDTAGFITKVGRADQSGAAIAVSMHYTDGNFGTPNQHWGVTPQEVGRFRQNKDNGIRVTFSDSNLAQKSQQYAQAIAAARSATGDNANVVPLDTSFPQGRPDVLAWGDISIVQLLGKIPWVYNEVGSTGFDGQKYADGIAAGIEKAVPSTGAASSATANGCESSGAVAGNVVQTAINYAWEDGRRTPAQKPSYANAVAQALAAHKYVGGGNPIGDDCGGFVTRVMQDSGADPNYGGGGATQIQEDYMIAHPEKYQLLHPTSTADLQPGDIAIINSSTEQHTYLYVGKQTGFATTVASASIPNRAPTAGGETPADPTYKWFRLIK